MNSEEQTGKQPLGVEESQDVQRPIQAHRRKNLRSPLIVMQAKEDQGRPTFFGYAKNISRGGMFIASVNPLEPGRRFDVEFSLPDPFARKVNCRCEIVWQRTWSSENLYEPGMGLKFVDIPEESAAAINEWVETTAEPPVQ